MECDHGKTQPHSQTQTTIPTCSSLERNETGPSLADLYNEVAKELVEYLPPVDAYNGVYQTCGFLRHWVQQKVTTCDTELFHAVCNGLTLHGARFTTLALNDFRELYPDTKKPCELEP